MERRTHQIISVLLLYVVSACSSTNIISHTALPKIIQDEGILLMSIKNLNEYQSYQLYESAKKKMSETNVIKYLPEQEYFLVLKGISKEDLSKNKLPDSLKSNIASITNSRYIIEVEVQGEKLLGTHIVLELQVENRYQNQDNELSSAQVFFTVFDTKGIITESKFQINSKISPLTINKRDGRETQVGISSGMAAVNKAFDKGIKQLKKGIIKN